MESLGIRCGNSISFNGSRSTRKKVVDQQSSCFQLVIKKNKTLNSKPMQKIQISQVCLTQNLEERGTRRITTTNAPRFPIPSFEKQEICSWEDQNNNKISPEKLDEWINDSVTEIVRNIGEAPFLVHLYSPATTKKTTNLELEREKARPDSWSTIRKRWEEGCPIPDGVILVEQLDKQKQLVLEIDDDYSKQENEEDQTTTTKWGVLVQGRGVDKVASYILKTCRVWSSLGFCTHFCLIKAKCFGDTAELQLQNSWNGVGNGRFNGNGGVIGTL